MTRSTRLAPSDGEDAPLAAINVTPFVDVVLVLLIIFMITAAVVEFGLQVTVPKTTVATAQPSKDFLTLQIASDGRLALNSGFVSIYDVAPMAKKRIRRNQKSISASIRARPGRSSRRCWPSVAPPASRST